MNYELYPQFDFEGEKSLLDLAREKFKQDNERLIIAAKIFALSYGEIGSDSLRAIHKELPESFRTLALGIFASDMTTFDKANELAQAYGKSDIDRVDELQKIVPNAHYHKMPNPAKLTNALYGFIDHAIEEEEIEVAIDGLTDSFSFNISRDLKSMSQGLNAQIS